MASLQEWYSRADVQLRALYCRVRPRLDEFFKWFNPVKKRNIIFMAILLIPIFFVSLTYVFFGFQRVKNKFKLSLIFLLGLFVVAISFPLVLVIFNGITGGLIEEEASFIWHVGELLTIQGGDIYMGAGGLLVIAATTILLTLQILLVGNKPT